MPEITTEIEIGSAIATELDQLIEYHNVRVYRLRADGWVVPVAMRGLAQESVETFVREVASYLRKTLAVKHAPA